ncbi:MAG TPA: Rieske (2Fe-2S) protein [Sediminibacterium sp.]|uniref:Rieske (2Fe-2S) protein n=1 Tax=Sediminibacterium sp. TaxID=1917865 RepID=UPI002B4B01D0|nr:Rieske (2Fe-2S) protein [Sediminibacterium sp.]HLD53456.1 Rieske (2Fe-2S) protein [Sediminibacterium sp.]
MATLLGSCATTKFSNGKLLKDGIVIDMQEFVINGSDKYRLYIVVRNEELVFPICVYRFSDKDYSAIWMQCAHQGAELNVAGDYLQCPAHGSEYDNRGKVTNGPADKNLRTFPVTINNNELFIDLRKI